ncbi:MAG: hypothetical protein Q8P52_01015 [bacterium]|nr:hypothetical protein [bacterium]
MERKNTSVTTAKIINDQIRISFSSDFRIEEISNRGPSIAFWISSLSKT